MSHAPSFLSMIGLNSDKDLHALPIYFAGGVVIFRPLSDQIIVDRSKVQIIFDHGNSHIYYLVELIIYNWFPPIIMMTDDINGIRDILTKLCKDVWIFSTISGNYFRSIEEIHRLLDKSNTPLEMSESDVRHCIAVSALIKSLQKILDQKCAKTYLEWMMSIISKYFTQEKQDFIRTNINTLCGLYL